MTTIKNAIVNGVWMTEIKKPPQSRRTERDQKWMEDWLEATLWKVTEEAIDAQGEVDLSEEMEDWYDQGQAIWLAETHGIMEPVRKRFPRLANLLKPPERPGKGKRFPKNNDYELIFNRDWDFAMLTQAVWDAKGIRFIWKQHYRPKPKGYGSAEEIAASLWGVKVHHVLEWKVSRECPKTPNWAHRVMLLARRGRERERKLERERKRDKS